MLLGVFFNTWVTGLHCFAKLGITRMPQSVASCKSHRGMPCGSRARVSLVHLDSLFKLQHHPGRKSFRSTGMATAAPLQTCCAKIRGRRSWRLQRLETWFLDLGTRFMVTRRRCCMGLLVEDTSASMSFGRRWEVKTNWQPLSCS